MITIIVLYYFVIILLSRLWFYAFHNEISQQKSFPKKSSEGLILLGLKLSNYQLLDNRNNTSWSYSTSTFTLLFLHLVEYSHLFFATIMILVSIPKFPSALWTFPHKITCLVLHFLNLRIKSESNQITYLLFFQVTFVPIYHHIACLFQQPLSLFDSQHISSTFAFPSFV